MNGSNGKNSKPVRGSDGVSDLEALLGYRFGRPELAEHALTHPSLEGRPNYQRLEFLGDRVIGLAVSNALYENFPDEREGRLSLRLTNLVRKETLAKIARRLGLGRCIRLADAATGGGGRENPALLADVLEAVLGAVFLDGGYQAAEDLIARLWQGSFDGSAEAIKDAKSSLQEWAQARGLAPPSYDLISRSGPDHDPTFHISALVDGYEPSEGKGASKRAAEQEAASELLSALKGGS